MSYPLHGVSSRTGFGSASVNLPIVGLPAATERASLLAQEVQEVLERASERKMCFFQTAHDWLEPHILLCW